MSKKALGLDIGVASVGWGVIDLEDNSFADAGVRLFKEITPAENLKRRAARGARRLKSRRVNRIVDLKKYLTEIQIIDEKFTYLSDPLQLRVKAINNQVNNLELANCLLHICKHRGNSMEVIEEDESKAKENETTKIQLKENDQLIKEGKEVCEIQHARLVKDGYYRGHQNNFRTSQYLREADRILSHSQLTQLQQKNITDIISRRRMYYEGTGSYKSPTKYGRYIIENKEVVQIDLIEKMRGKCTIYPDQGRAPRNSYSAELHNFLNDLNNLNIDGKKITVEEKKECLRIIDVKGNITPTQLAKLLETAIEKIGGFRVDKKATSILTEFVGLKKLRKALDADIADELITDKKLVDQIIDILVVKKGIDERRNALKQLDHGLAKSTIDALANITGVTTYHAFSYKALNMLNEELLVSDMNQMQIIQLNGLLKKTNSIHKGHHKIRFDEEAVLSPVAKQAHREAIKVVNELRKKYGEFESIIVETTRAKNSDDEKKIINDRQKYGEEQNKKITELVGKSNIPGDVRLKIRLYEQQDGKCMYTNEAISLDLIMNDYTAYEIDHIIPISISLDDSINNKVLVLYKANQAKGNLTPYQAFQQNKFSISYNEFKATALNLLKTNKISKTKLGYLLCEDDISKYEVMARFINRNLADTSYVNRVVLNTLQEYFKVNEINTKVFTVKGKATSAFRNRIGLHKDREESYAHHAIDALIVASISKNKLLHKVIRNSSIKGDQIHFNDTGEIWDINKENDEYLDNSYISFIKKLHKLPITKYSWKVDRKPNRQLADETIYSTRVINGVQRVIKKYKNIYEPKFVSLAIDIQNQQYDKYLMFRHDKQTFEKLIAIVADYNQEFGSIEKSSKVNPFDLYFQKHGSITKYAKMNNGPAIVSIKYDEANLGNHIDISKNYQINDSKKVVILQISPYRTDIYLDSTGRYRFVTIRYSNLTYYHQKGGFVIDEGWYKEQLVKKGIDDIDDFVYSLNRNDVITLADNNRDGLFRFVVTNADADNKIEVKPLSHYEKKQLMVTIGKNTKSIIKYNCSVIGNLTKQPKEKLHLNKILTTRSRG